MHHVSVRQAMQRRNARLIVRTATNRACFGDEAFAVESTLITTCRVHFLLVTAEGVAVAVPAARAGRVELLEAVLVEHAHAVHAALRVSSECRECMYGRESRGLVYHFGHGEHLAALVPERLEDNATLVVALVLWHVHVCVRAPNE